jgi:sec-independent protein translocase protein TatA
LERDCPPCAAPQLAFAAIHACFCRPARLRSTEDQAWLRGRNLGRRGFTLGMADMGSFSIWHWMLFGAVALLLFGGKGKISDLMGDVAKGIKSFKKGMAEDDTEAKAPAPAPASLPIESRGVTVDASDKQKVS